MTAYTIIPDTSIDGDSGIDSALLTAFRDNPIAIAEGALGAPAITSAINGASLKSVTAGTIYGGLQRVGKIGSAYDGNVEMNSSYNEGGTSYVEYFNCRIIQSGTYRVSFWTYGDGGSNNGYGRIYKNGVAFGTEQNSSGASPIQKTEDLIFTAGDTVQLFGKAQTSTLFKLKEFMFGVSAISQIVAYPTPLAVGVHS